jgi:hypothetical protein
VFADATESDSEAEQRDAGLRAAIADCDRELANCRALLDHDDAVTVAAEWITDTQRERKESEHHLGQHGPGFEMTPAQVKALGVTLRYDPDRVVSVRAYPRGVTVRVGGPSTPSRHLETALLLG